MRTKRCPRCKTDLGNNGLVAVVGKLYRGSYNTETKLVEFNRSSSSFKEEIYEIHCSNCGFVLEGKIYHEWRMIDDVEE